MIRADVALDSHRRARQRGHRGDGGRRLGGHHTRSEPELRRARAAPRDLHLPSLLSKSPHRRGADSPEIGSPASQSGVTRLPQLFERGDINDGGMRRAASEAALKPRRGVRARQQQSDMASAADVDTPGLDFEGILGAAKRRVLARQATRRANGEQQDQDSEPYTPLCPPAALEKPREQRMSALAMIAEARRCAEARDRVGTSSPSRPVDLAYPSRRRSQDVTLAPLGDRRVEVAPQVTGGALGQTELARAALQEINTVAKQVRLELGGDVQKSPTHQQKSPTVQRQPASGPQHNTQDREASSDSDVAADEARWAAQALAIVPAGVTSPASDAKTRTSTTMAQAAVLANILAGAQSKKAATVSLANLADRRDAAAEQSAVTQRPSVEFGDVQSREDCIAGESKPCVLVRMPAAIPEGGAINPSHNALARRRRVGLLASAEPNSEVHSKAGIATTAVHATPTPSPKGSPLAGRRFSVASCADRMMQYLDNPPPPSIEENDEDMQLSLREEESVRLVFKRFQVPNEKEVHAEDLAELLKCLGYVVPEVEVVKRLRAEITPYEYLDFDELLSFVGKYARWERKYFRELFVKFDKDGSGDISASELRALVPSFGLIPLRTMIQEAIEVCDLDGSGTLNFQEFLRFLVVYRHTEYFTRKEVAKLKMIFDSFATPGFAKDGRAVLPVASLADALVQNFGISCEAAALRVSRRVAANASRTGLRQSPVSAKGAYDGLPFHEFLMYARRLREDEHERCREEFAKYDVDGSGRISPHELASALKNLGYEPVKEVISEVLEDVLGRKALEHRFSGSDEDGLDFEEFFHFFLLFSERDGFTLEQLANMRKVFERFDEDKSGELEVLELGAVLRHMGYIISVDDIHVMAAKVDRHRSNRLDFVEFVRLMRLNRESELERARAVFNSCGGDSGAGALAGSIVTAALADVLGSKPPTKLVAASVRAGGVDWEEFVFLMDECREACVGAQQKKAGFCEEEIELFRGMFDRYDHNKSGDIDAKEMECVLRDLGIVNRTRAEQQAVLEELEVARRKAREAGVEGVSLDGSGCVGFWEFVQLLRLVRIKTDREEEDVVARAAAEASFSQHEVIQFREIFLEWSKAPSTAGSPSGADKRRRVSFSAASGDSVEPGLSPDTVKRLLRIALKLKISPRQSDELDAQIAKLDPEKKKRLDLPAFLRLMRWLLDSNFAGVNEKAAQVAEDKVVKYYSGQIK